MFCLCCKKQGVDVTTIGLDNAGKTAIIKLLAGTCNRSDAIKTTPTKSVDVLYKNIGNKKISFWDCPGNESLRRYWSYQFETSFCFIFVIDAVDVKRFSEISNILKQMASNTHAMNKFIIILANKQDIGSALSSAELEARINFQSMNFAYKIIETSAISGLGIQTLYDTIKEKIA
ncbi:hypothetical protein A3Q56_04963 [Intoshia linei]|uniref:Uncharacterized protein n=1 Tax=Intoshia linei TaxID=1819745 RepID=A0A177AZ35_9BILA|nr:hypothetical protein A3Q56_04963 [Intoshia linei]